MATEQDMWTYWQRGLNAWPVEKRIRPLDKDPVLWFVCGSEDAAEHACEILNSLEEEVRKLRLVAGRRKAKA